MARQESNLHPPVLETGVRPLRLVEPEVTHSSGVKAPFGNGGGDLIVVENFFEELEGEGGELSLTATNRSLSQ